MKIIFNRNVKGWKHSDTPGSHWIPGVPVLLWFLQDPKNHMINTEMWWGGWEGERGSAREEKNNTHSWTWWTSSTFLSIFSIHSLQEKVCEFVLIIKTTFFLKKLDLPFDLEVLGYQPHQSFQGPPTMYDNGNGYTSNHFRAKLNF